MALQHRAARCALTATRATRRGYATDTPASIFKNSAANKVGLSYALDGAMRNGSHDMRVFGTGTLAALVSRASLAKFLAAHHHFYAELETRLDDAARGSDPTPSGALWRRFSAELRRAPSLADDVSVLLDDSVSEHAPTPAVAAYVGGIARAAERESSSPDAPPLLIAHFYVRYFADLFGASISGGPPSALSAYPASPSFTDTTTPSSATGARPTSSPCTRPSTRWEADFRGRRRTRWRRRRRARRAQRRGVSGKRRGLVRRRGGWRREGAVGVRQGTCVGGQ